MFLRRAQANDTNSVIIRAFRENHHIKAYINQPDGDETDFSIIEPVILALERCIPIKAGRRCQGNAMLGPVSAILDRIELNSHLIYVHPLNDICKHISILLR